MNKHELVNDKQIKQLTDLGVTKNQAIHLNRREADDLIDKLIQDYIAAINRGIGHDHRRTTEQHR